MLIPRSTYSRMAVSLLVIFSSSPLMIVEACVVDCSNCKRVGRGRRGEGGGVGVGMGMGVGEEEEEG